MSHAQYVQIVFQGSEHPNRIYIMSYLSVLNICKKTFV